MAIQIFRIVQALLNNSAQHSKAEKIEAFFRIEHGFLKINFSDNGVGFNIDSISHGMGLENIKNRVRLIKGELEFSSMIGNGVNYKITIPVDKKFE
ncbi:MAG TPA: hypothetical protein DCQ93_07075 [Bacteroidetes bacterium]|nr:hypothetical protein [Bacteroidota bacterium]